MVPQTLTVLVAIRPGEEARLRDVLRPIGDDIEGRRPDEAAGRVRIEFTRSRRIHFARFAILADPDRGPRRQRLLYSATYDGDLDAHLAELTAITSDMDAIWGRCEAYAGAAGFARFMRAHALESAAFYIAFRDETVRAHPGCDRSSTPGGDARRFQSGRPARVDSVPPHLAVRRR